MKFTRTFTDKLVSYVDRHFTYDIKDMKREDIFNEGFDFCASNFDTDTTVAVIRLRGRLWVAIRRKDKCIHQGFLETYSEVNAFKKMILCLG